MELDSISSLQIFYKMLKVRLFEEKAVMLKQQKIINDELYLSAGQEAAAAAVYALANEDIVFASHRNSAVALSCDTDMGALFAEMAGLEEGVCRGRSGSSSFGDNKVGFYPASAAGDGNFLTACGAALSNKLQHRDVVCTVFASEGACSRGDFYEALNVALLKGLKIVFYIQNNLYAGRTPITDSFNTGSVASRAKGYDIPAIEVDGNNAADVFEAMGKALEYTREYSAPILVEAKTYRLAGYTFEENQNYRTEEEVEGWLGYDPIEILKDYMLRQGYGIAEDLLMLRAKIQREVDEAAEKTVKAAKAREGEKDL